MKREPKFITCHECNRGGNGNDPDKCACGWKITSPSSLGCFTGVPIAGAPRKLEKLTRSQARYRRYLEVADMFVDFKDFLKQTGDKNGK